MSDKIKRVLALGDSYTIGERVRSNERWVTVLAQKLRDDGLVIANPRIIAKSAWTTDELLHHLELVRPESHFDLVTLMIGVNNQYRGRDVDDYSLDVRELAELAIGCAGGCREHVVAISIPDWGVTPFAKDRDRSVIAAEIDQFNRVLQAVVSELSIRHVDVTDISRKPSDASRWIAEDDLHPGADMHREWAERIRPVAKTILSQ